MFKKKKIVKHKILSKFAQKEANQRRARRQEHLKKLDDRRLLKMFLKRNVHVSFHKKHIKKEFYSYLHCFFNDFGIINLKKTMFQIRTAGHLLYQIAKNRGKVIIVDSPFVSFQDLEKLVMLKEIKFLKRSRWIPGILLNQRSVKNSMKNYISKRFTKKDKKFFFESIVYDLGNIDLLIITDPLSSKEIIEEASNAGVPIMAFVDLNGFLSKIDYPIVCNNQTRQSIFFLLQILHLSFKKGHDEYLRCRHKIKTKHLFQKKKNVNDIKKEKPKKRPKKK